MVTADNCCTTDRANEWIACKILKIIHIYEEIQMYSYIYVCLLLSDVCIKMGMSKESAFPLSVLCDTAAQSHVVFSGWACSRAEPGAAAETFPCTTSEPWHSSCKAVMGGEHKKITGSQLDPTMPSK